MSAKTALCRAFLAAGLIASAAACNSQDPVLDSPVAPTRSTVPLPALSAPTFANITPSVPALIGGRSTHGTVTLGLQAPAGGLVVTLSSSDPSVMVPPSATVPPGAYTVGFPITTQAVPDDRQVAITAFAAGESVSSPLAVWTTTPPFFSFVRGQNGPGNWVEFGRLSSDTATFSGFCSESEVNLSFRGPATSSGSASFAAPNGLPLSVGVYENGLSVSGCAAVSGRFVVHEVELTADGHVRRFWATFEQVCAGVSWPFHGDIRVTEVPRSASFATSCLVP